MQFSANRNYLPVGEQLGRYLLDGEHNYTHMWRGCQRLLGLGTTNKEQQLTYKYFPYSKPFLKQDKHKSLYK